MPRPPRPLPASPRYVEELEARLAEKDRMLQDYIEQHKSAAGEFEESRARARRDVGKEVERGKRAILVDLLEVVDNLDRAIESAKERASIDMLVHGVEMVRQQFLQRLEGFGIHTDRAAAISPSTRHGTRQSPWCPRRDRKTTRRSWASIRRGYRSATKCCGRRRSPSGARGADHECTMHNARCTMHNAECTIRDARPGVQGMAMHTGWVHSVSTHA